MCGKCAPLAPRLTPFFCVHVGPRLYQLPHNFCTTSFSGPVQRRPTVPANDQLVNANGMAQQQHRQRPRHLPAFYVDVGASSNEQAHDFQMAVCCSAVQRSNTVPAIQE